MPATQLSYLRANHSVWNEFIPPIDKGTLTGFMTSVLSFEDLGSPSWQSRVSSFWMRMDHTLSSMDEDYEHISNHMPRTSKDPWNNQTDGQSRLWGEVYILMKHNKEPGPGSPFLEALDKSMEIHGLSLWKTSEWLHQPIMIYHVLLFPCR